jgi:signal transduction histidine kinase
MSNDIDNSIMKVIYPFERQIFRQEIKVFISKQFSPNLSIIADWMGYQLILFNIIQNSVKYNKFKGEIFVIIQCLPMTKKRNQRRENSSKVCRQSLDEVDTEEKYILETVVIDTGIGISKKRQKMLFTPFLELKMKQNLKKVKDHNIGIGLACSNSISKALNGDITVKKSKRGLTAFAFKIPVQVKLLDKQVDFPANMIKLNDQAQQENQMSEVLLSFLQKCNVVDF